MMSMYRRVHRVTQGTRSLFLVMSMIVGIPIGAVTNWSGGPIPGNVTNDDIVISGTNTIGTTGNPYSITVTSNDGNTHTITASAFSIIQGNGGAAGGLAQFIFDVPNANDRIEVILQNELWFQANRNVGPEQLLQPFQVLVRGQGTVEFQIDGGSRFLLGDNSNPAISAGVGVHMLVLMEGTSANPAPHVRFVRMLNGSNLTARAAVELDRSLLSYLSQQLVSNGGLTDVADITFDAGNQVANPQGVISLLLSDKASVIVSGHFYEIDDSPAGLTYYLDRPAGLDARFNTANASQFSGLFVYNDNRTLNSALPTPATNSLLVNPFCIDQIFGNSITNAYTGLLYGFVVQANGSLNIANNSYMFYQARSTNVNPLPFLALSCNRLLSQYVKERNPAALTFDDNTNINATPPAVNLAGESALYLAGAVNCSNCLWTTSFFGIEPDGSIPLCDQRGNEVGGAGLIAMDVEGRLNVTGDESRLSAINVVSLSVNTTGGSVLNDQTSTVFPLRNYLTWDDGAYQRFPRTAIMVRGLMTLTNTNLKHDDLSHNADVKFLPGNYLLQDPEPTYIGSESGVNIPSNVCVVSGCPNPLVVCPGGERRIALVNSSILAHSNLCSTALTWIVPNAISGGASLANLSLLTLFSNGNCFSALNGTQKTGVTFTLGSRIGAVAANGSTVLDPSAYLDVFQAVTSPDAGALQNLNVVDSYNNNKFLPQLPSSGGTLIGQYNVHSVVNLFGSNICVGTDVTTTPSPFPLITNPALNIFARYVNFISQGGALQDPSSTGSSGQGGIFIDTNGSINVAPNVLVGFDSTTIAKSGNGIVNLPGYQTFYGAGAGIQQWNLDLTNNNILIPLGTTVNEYTLDWQIALKDFCDESPYVPYERSLFDVGSGQFSPAVNVPVIPANLVNLPTVQGVVDGQFQIRNSRLGDNAQLVVDGGLVREVVFLNNNTPGIGAIGTIIVQDDGIVGLGSAMRSYDSIYAQMVLGVNGVTLVANGDGQVILNQDVLINNYCHILTGPDFGVAAAQQLLITAEVPREIRVKNGGVLDLSQFTNYNQRLAIGGQVKLVFEPGSKLLLGGGELFFVGDAQMTFEPFIDFNFPVQTLVSGTNPYRVAIASVGGTANFPSRLTFKEGSRCFVPRGALVGVEVLSPVLTVDDANVTSTYQSWLITDDARLELGNSSQYGGGLQIGNTVSNDVANAVNWILILNGQNATLELEGQGFLGLGMGIINKPSSQHGNWLIGSLYNVGSIALQLTQGVVSYRTLYDSSSVDAGLLAISGGVSTFTYSANRVDILTLGGGNVMYVPASSTSAITPVVNTALSYGTGTSAYNAGILASTLTLLNYSKSGTLGNPMTISGAQNVFNFITMDDYLAQDPYKSAVVTPISLGQQGVGYVYNGSIWRQLAGAYRFGSAKIGASSALAIGAAGLALDTSVAEPITRLTVVNANGNGN